MTPMARGRDAKLALAPLLVMLPLCACAPAAPDATPDPGSFIAIPADGDRQMGENEPNLLAASHGRARRMGDDLILHFANGEDRRFHNDNKGCEDGPGHCEGYLLIGDLPAFHWFVLFQTAYEGGNFLLIDDRDGLPTSIPFWPIFSPDGLRLLIQNDDESDFFEGDALEIWRREGQRMQREWIANPDEGDTGVHTDGVLHTRLLSWKGDRMVLEFRTDEVFDTKTRLRTPARHWTGTITRAADGWHLNARAGGAEK